MNKDELLRLVELEILPKQEANHGMQRECNAKKQTGKLCWGMMWAETNGKSQSGKWKNHRIVINFESYQGGQDLIGPNNGPTEREKMGNDVKETQDSKTEICS